jgi:hypothetical protein
MIFISLKSNPLRQQKQNKETANIGLDMHNKKRYLKQPLSVFSQKTGF